MFPGVMANLMDILVSTLEGVPTTQVLDEVFDHLSTKGRVSFD